MEAAFVALPKSKQQKSTSKLVRAIVVCVENGAAARLAVDCGEDVAFEGEENISVFSSSEWAERGFCNKCGAVSCPLLPFRQARKMGAFGQGDMHWSTN